MKQSYYFFNMTNKDLIQKFYTSFQNKDYKGMQDCYADTATFSDSVFQNLDAKKVRAMWHMLVSGGKDMQLTFSNVKADESSGSCDWVAEYTFSLTGNKVVNRIHAEFQFKDGKIVSHKDAFDFYVWARQAFGLKGLLFGWMENFQRTIQNRSTEKLAAFVEKNSEYK
jgi:ketosteroid isomerase-like protein